MRLAKQPYLVLLIALVCVGLTSYVGLRLFVAIPREDAVRKYGCTRFNCVEDLELRSDGTYACRFRPESGVEFTSAGRWDFEAHGVTSVVILRGFAPKCAGAPEGKRDWRFTLTEDSGIYLLEGEGCTWNSGFAQ